MQATHEVKLDRIVKQLKQREGTAYLKLKKKTVSHMVPKPESKTYTDEKLDISDFDEILSIDQRNRICVAEPGVTFEKLVEATLKHDLIPAVVSELKTITIGGAVAGCSIESMSYKVGGFHDNCLEYEVVTAKGEVLNCTPDNENSLLFQMIHGTFGTLGIITKLTFKLLPAKPFVRVVYERFENLDDYKKAIWEHFENKDLDFMDGIIHSPDLFILSKGYLVDEAPYTHNYDWTRIYYTSTAERSEDYLTTPDYFFRYNKGVTNVHPKTRLLRFLFGRIMNANTTLRMATILRRFIPSKLIPVTVDTFIPFSKIEEFMDWYIKEIDHFPLWCVPYRIVHKYEWISEDFFDNVTDELFLDIAIYGMRIKNSEFYYKIIEDKLTEINAIKTLISTNLYSKNEFWNVWNKENYEIVKKRTDPDNIFRDLYDKTCLAARGLDEEQPKTNSGR
ncbi:FAD-binding oxidoreductase [Lacticigenium naphthae]|uniref:FAD-binding oxidoreductase n=1 Tax=Lacticigenium naphthae TaxID=515351 RepID=UPI0003FEA0DC|nr:FAD-binding oxidoreductase [Lacticigenium naphthae]